MQQLVNDNGQACRIDDMCQLVDGLLVRVPIADVVDSGREDLEAAVASLAGFPAMEEVRFDVEGHEGNVLLLRVRGDVRRDATARHGLFPCTDAIRQEFLRRGFYLDDEESSFVCVAFSRIEIVDGHDDTIWLGLVWAAGMEIYALHPRFETLPKGLFMQCESDGAGYLTVRTSSASDLDNLVLALDALEAAVNSVFGHDLSLGLLP